MFLALSEQLDLVKGVRISHVQLRRTVVQYLKDNPKLVSGLILLLVLIIYLILLCVKFSLKAAP